VVVIGAGETSELMARALAEQGAGTIFLANRHADRALSLAERFGGQVVALEELPDQLTRADIVLASTDATFGLPEVDRGALGAATHLARLVPQQRMREMVYTSATATADELHDYGTVLAVVEPDRLQDAAYALARRIAEKSPVVIRAAKESLNGIDPVDVKRSYRYEQGYTFELNLSGIADEARNAFVDKRDPEFGE